MAHHRVNHVTAKQLIKILTRLGCYEARRSKGSHAQWVCGKCRTTIPCHAGEDIGTGLLGQIKRDLDPCLGKGWMD